MAKVKVNHNGSCEGYVFDKNKAFEVADGDLGKLQAALGDDLEVVEKTSKKDANDDDAAAKEAKPAENRMLKNDQKVTK